MPRSIRTLRRAAPVALAALLVLAPPASAHPFVQGGEAPVDSLAEVTLTLAHGCGTEDAGGGDPTVEIAMEVPADVRIVEVPEVEGYAVGLEQDADGRVEVVTWTATEGGEPAPQLPFDAVFSGEPGDEIFLKVFQGCDGFSYRWIGTPDEPADDPAIRVQLIEADPDRPAPDPAPTPDPETSDPDAETRDPEDAGEPDEGTEDPDAADDPDIDDDPQTADDASDEVEPSDTAAQGSDGSGPNIVLITTVGLLLVATIAAILGMRSRRRAIDGGPQDE